MRASEWGRREVGAGTLQRGELREKGKRLRGKQAGAERVWVAEGPGWWWLGKEAQGRQEWAQTGGLLRL